MEAKSTTEILVDEAQRRGLTIKRISEINPNFVRLEHGDHYEFIYYSGSNLLGYISSKIFLNKYLSGPLLHDAGFPVPAEIATDDAKDIEAFLEKYKKIVIKPLDTTWGKGVTPGIAASQEIAPAIELARSYNENKKMTAVICQEHITGTEYRILVINKEHIIACRRVPANVVGDGQKTVEELIKDWNTQVRSERQIGITEQTHEMLREQDMDLQSIPSGGEVIPLRYIANLHAGGMVYDATDEIGAQTREVAINIAKYFNAPVVGVDSITPDISKSIGHVIELNSTPDIAIHHYPTAGPARNPAAIIIDMLFPETKIN